MKYLFILLLLSGCGNSWMCEFKDPNEMTDAELQICSAYFVKKNTVIVR